jgi:hypothetical protein
MIPEQVWDRHESPRPELRLGEGTGSDAAGLVDGAVCSSRSEYHPRAKHRNSALLLVAILRIVDRKMSDL